MSVFEVEHPEITVTGSRGWREQTPERSRYFVDGVEVGFEEFERRFRREWPAVSAAPRAV